MSTELPGDADAGPATTLCVAVVWLFVCGVLWAPGRQEPCQQLAQGRTHNYSGNMCWWVNDSTLHLHSFGHSILYLAGD